MAAVSRWKPAEFHHWYSQMPRDGRKRRAWNDLLPAHRKLYIEWSMFGKFARVAPLDIDPRMINNCEPPEPDIRCLISRGVHYFELGEVTDESLAQQAGRAAKQGLGIFGGSFSELSPLWRILQQKWSKKYDTYGRPLHLLLYYSVGHQVPDAPLVENAISNEHEQIVKRLQTSPFTSLWFYDGWADCVITSVRR